MGDPQYEHKRQQLAELMPRVYGELRKVAAHHLSRERPNHTLQPTALVNEVYLKFQSQRRLDILGRTHFVALASMAMRQILVDHARTRRAVKRGGDIVLITLDDAASISETKAERILELHLALEKLERLDPQEARIVEMRFFGGLTEIEIAAELGISDRWVRAQWSHARAWLRRELAGQ
jgi:RNA polymerase sigma factor (TIGR02999 family)